MIENDIQAEAMRDKFFDLLIYKTRQMIIIPYLWVINFDKGNTSKARIAERIFRIVLVVAYGTEVFFAILDIFVTGYVRTLRDTSQETVQSEFEYVLLDVV